ncbi:unnamed protein product [Rhizoctonia solani]|uniref:CCHC-type domain-containing protein n=1 Tax=Rhizoctonia solani TaxID=456999 RepID=A0A8H3GB26_9AGAM|nr:unnamed protein product [Rhizoctonia solani]
MPDDIIDLTASDDEVKEIGRPTSRASNSTRSRRKRTGGRRGKGVSQDVAEAEATENVQPSNGPSSASGSGNKSQSEQAKSNSLLSRLGMIPPENKKENTKSKRDSRDRRPNEKGKDHRGRADDSRVQTETSQTGAGGAHHRWSRSPSPNQPKEIPLSELPVEQLFFIDTGPLGGVGGEQEQPTPLGTGSTTPSTPGTSAIPNAKAIKRKLAKERKKERKASEEDKVSGDTPNSTPNQVEFIGGSALAVEDQAVTSDTATSAAGTITTLSTSVTEPIQAEVVKPTSDGGTKSNGLSLPEHVTLWVEADDAPSLEDATAALEIEEGIEYLDYEDDQATGVPRYFISETAASSKKACRTCGEEGHIARNCKKLICLTCGERDDHDTRNCPMRVVCFNCGGKGHLSSTCPQPRGRVGCDRCGSSKHIPQRCPDQFKTYTYLSEEERLQVLKKREALKELAFGDGGEGYIAQHIWCYNCGNGGHWGDDCKDSKPYSMPTEPCAFGSFNASRGPFGDLDNSYRSRDAPRPAWMDDDPHLQDVGRRGKEANMKRNRAAEASRIARDHDDDDWFSRAAGSSRDQRQASDRIKDNLPAKPKFSFQSRDNGGGSSRPPPGGHDNTRDRERDRRREKDRDKGYDNERHEATTTTRDDAETTKIGVTRNEGVDGQVMEVVNEEETGIDMALNTEDHTHSGISEKLSGVSVNVESYDGDEGQHSDHTKRVLNARQVQLFSIGGTIGTSIFVAIGSALVHGGPLSLLLGYAFWCSVIFCVNEGQAEMVCLLPIESSFNRFATRWVDRAFGAATSWNYWICMVALFNFEITAFTAVVGFWTDDVHPAVFPVAMLAAYAILNLWSAKFFGETEFWISLMKVILAVFPVAMLAAYAILNLWSAKFFGETEFWISLMKVILITGLLIMTFFLMVGVNPQRDAFGFRFWRDPGPMAEYISTGDLGRFQGFFACVLSAGFAVAGPDMLSIIAGEAKAPRRIIVFIRLILFFVLGSLAVGILVPYNDPLLNAAISEGKPGAARSPYVAALTRLNVPVLPHIINAMILTSIFSAGNAFLFNGSRNAFLFNGSRTLHGIALDGFAPSFIRHTNRNGVPWVAVTCTIAMGLLSFLQVNESSSKVLDWFINVSTSAQLVTWIAMSITWIRWDAAMKAQGISRDILPYKSRFQPYGAWYGLFMSLIVTFFNGYYVFLKGGWVTADFIFAYGSVL